MGKSKNKTRRIDVRLTQDEHDTLANIVKFRGIGTTDLIAKMIEEEGKKVKKEQEELARKRYFESLGIEM